MDDKNIIGLLYARSEQAIGELAKKYGKLVRRVASNILNNADDAEECENDTWLACWNSIPPEYPQVLTNYVCRIARNLAVSRYRSATAQKRSSRYDVALEELADSLSCKESMEDEIQAQELGEAINRFLAGLREEDRVLFVRRYWFSDSVPDLAKLLDCPENRISVRLFRIRDKLHCYLRKEGLLP